MKKQKNDGEILDCFNNLLTQIDFLESKITNIRSKKGNNYLSGIRNFQKTEFKTNDIGNKIINILNKLSFNNFEDQKIEILKLIDNEKSLHDNLNLYCIYDNILKIIKKNENYIDLYVKFYKVLQNYNNYFINIIDDMSKNLQDNIIIYENFNLDNYDHLCKFNKKNDENKNILKFLLKIIDNDNSKIKLVEDILKNLFDNFNSNIDNFDKKNTNEIMIEFICLILLDNKFFYDKYLDDIISISNLKVKLNKGLTNKIIFKIMDVLDYYA